MLKAIAGKPKRFKSLTVMATNYDDMSTHYVETSNLSDSKIARLGYGGQSYSDACRDFSGQIRRQRHRPVFCSGSALQSGPTLILESTSGFLNAHLHRMLERQDRDALENGSRMLTHLGRAR